MKLKAFIKMLTKAECSFEQQNYADGTTHIQLYDKSDINYNGPYSEWIFTDKGLLLSVYHREPVHLD